MPSSISRAFHPSRYNLNKISRIVLELREVLDALEDEAYMEDEADDKFFGEIIRQINHVQKPSQASTPKPSNRQNQRTSDEEDDCGSDCSLGDRPQGGVSSSVKGSINGSKLRYSRSTNPSLHKKMKILITILKIQKEFVVLGGKLQPTIGSTAEQKLLTIRSELLATSNSTGNSGGGGCLDVEEESRTMKIEILKRILARIVNGTVKVS
ncbi:hypothetical protein PPACK8108_LOCUS10668 [Phakopsora pachyrhizi]|uniref:Uncharacterized protein n=1 Tax=Phakopsora pachyrhizi TaxID=170000 RepID=A0AAV0B0S6_PHAPC|nr:hypothetical protein PPACK8108_LOCUS10668 [Phakopsora pachyrhizi]